MPSTRQHTTRVNIRARRRAIGIAAMAAVFALAVPGVAMAVPADDAGSADAGSADGLGSVTDGLALGSAVIPEGFIEGIVNDVAVNGIPTSIEGLIDFGTNTLNGAGSLAPTPPCSATTSTRGPAASGSTSPPARRPP